MTDQLLRSALLALALAAAPATWAQTPPAANAPLPGTDFLRSGGDPKPDTTAPRRYYPLEVGNVWEYEDDEGALRRHTVEKDTFALGSRYFIVRQEYALNGKVASVYRMPLRFDTTSATVRLLTSTDPPDDTLEHPCPLDAPFDTVIECEFGPYDVAGTYDGVLVFGGERPGTGADTVRTAVKRYASSQTGFEIRYGAGVGVVLELGDGFFRALTYYRVGGEEHGLERFPVSGEPGPPTAPVLALEAWPNPFRERFTVAFEVARSEALRLAVFDTRGRCVKEQSLGHLPPGRHEIALDGSALTPGVYLVRLSGAEGGARTSPVVRLR